MKNYTKRKFKRDLVALLFILPALIHTFIFTFYPLFKSFYYSLTSWDLILPQPRFVMFDNYKKIFTSEEFYKSLINTFLYAFYVMPLTMVLGFFIALAIYKKSKLNVFFRTIFFTPSIVSMVAISAVWLYIYHPQYGILNQVVKYLGYIPIRFLNDKSTVLPSLAFISVWKQLGFSIIIYIGGLQNINTDVMEAAKVDGANYFQTIKNIILPLIAPTIFMLFLLQTIESLQIFTTINVMTGGGPNGSSTTLLVLMFNYAFEKYQVGYSSALSVIIFIIILIISFLQMKLEKKVNYV